MTEVLVEKKLGEKESMAPIAQAASREVYPENSDRNSGLDEKRKTLAAPAIFTLSGNFLCADRILLVFLRNTTLS